MEALGKLIKMLGAGLLGILIVGLVIATMVFGGVIMIVIAIIFAVYLIGGLIYMEFTSPKSKNDSSTKPPLP
jgi:uncharacterized membrane protein